MERSLKDYAGSWVLLYFYPKDDTPGCTKEACGLKSYTNQYKRRGITILGISADPVEKHKEFSKKYGLPFRLLSDETKQTIEAYGAWQEKSMYGKMYMGIVRMSYLIDPKGTIVKIYPDVDPERHAGEVLKDTEKLQQA